MAENNQNNNDSASSVLSHAASAAGMAKSAVKTGKAIAGMSKGAAAGPYGMIACEWHNKNTHFWRRKFPTCYALIYR